MKKITAFLGRLLALSILAAPFGTYADSYSGSIHWEYSGPWEWEESNLKTVSTSTGYKQTCEAMITGYTGSATDIEIPEKIKMSQTVTANGNVAVHWEYEATVTGIGNSAFENKSSLKSVTIPDSVQYIADGYSSQWVDRMGAFLNCCGLEHISIGNSVTNIGAYAFAGCGELTSVTLPSNLKRIGGGAFLECHRLTSVVIPASVAEMGSVWDRERMGAVGAFYNCSGLTSAVISEGVTNIGISAFAVCSDLTNVKLPSTLKRIEGGAFKWCSGLTSLVIPEGVVEIGSVWDYESRSGAFSGCTSLTSVTIPNSVTSIEEYAFDRCTSLTSVTIPDSVTNIGKDAFYGCSGLTSMTLPFVGARRGNSGTSDSVFGYIFGEAYGQSYTYQSYGNGDIKVTIPPSLKSVTITDETTLGYGAFYNCSELTSVTIPDSVTSIGSSAFYNCSSLTSVTIPDSVTSIGDYAFGGCSGLTSVTIPDSVTSIGSSAFYNCSSLTSVTIPDSVMSIGSSAFSGCSGLRDVYLSDVAAWCGIEFPNQYSSPFYYAQNLYLNDELVTALEIPDGVARIGIYAFYNCDCLQSVSIPDSVTSVESSAFCNCDSITSASAPQSVMSQGLSSVLSASYQKLRSLRLGANVTAIGANEFDNCRALTSVAVADGNASYVVLADGCLYDNARNLLLFCPRDKVRIDISDGVTALGNYAFQYCTNLVSVSMPETVQSIGSGSFVGCSKLSGLTIPGSVQTLPTAAFNGCDVLWTEWYRALANLAVTGGGSSGGGSAEPADPRYALAANPADRAIASVTVEADCAIDSFVLTDGKVYDTVLRVVNTSDGEVHLTFPPGHVYETFRGARPLTIPANSRNMLTITRTADDTFLVSREELETVQ